MGKVGVSQKAVIFNKEGKFLILLRGKTAPSNPLKWDLPGGDVDWGEDPHESMAREIKEETGLEVGELTVFDVSARVTEDNYHWFTVAYRTNTKTEKVKISWEHDEFKWVNHKEFRELPTIPKIARFIEKLAR